MPIPVIVSPSSIVCIGSVELIWLEGIVWPSGIVIVGASGTDDGDHAEPECEHRDEQARNCEPVGRALIHVLWSFHGLTRTTVEATREGPMNSGAIPTEAAEVPISRNP